MPARSAEAIKRKYQNHLRKNKQRRQALITALGNRCDWYRIGDCEGELELHHRYGHASDPGWPWTIPKYEKEFRDGKLGLLCRKHNHADGQERRRKIFQNENRFLSRGIGR